MNRSAYYIEQAKRCSEIANSSLVDAVKARLLLFASAKNSNVAELEADHQALPARPLMPTDRA